MRGVRPGGQGTSWGPTQLPSAHCVLPARAGAGFGADGGTWTAGTLTTGAGSEWRWPWPARLGRLRPGRRCRCARAQPGLRRPSPPSALRFHSFLGLQRERSGRGRGGARPIPAPPGARRDGVQGARRPRAPLSGLHVPGASGKPCAHWLLRICMGLTRPRASFLPWSAPFPALALHPSRTTGARNGWWPLISRSPLGVWMIPESVVYSLSLPTSLVCLFVSQSVNKHRG